eukprot:4595068-Pyramimonas_sp.AAC.1
MSSNISALSQFFRRDARWQEAGMTRLSGSARTVVAARHPSASTGASIVSSTKRRARTRNPRARAATWALHLGWMVALLFTVRPFSQASSRPAQTQYLSSRCQSCSN